MRLHRLGYSNFGPFKGDQAIEFPDSHGVTVIYGDNNLGKTTILNSIRWLFTGKFLERTGRARDDRELVNREAIDEANGEPVITKVSATVTWRGTKYELARAATLHNDQLKPSLHVLRGSNSLSAEEGLATLRQMIPEDIQQFFLFDAEALNRYEDLLHDPTAGEALKKAIERILGVPVLKNAVQDLASLTEKHTKVISKLKTKDAKAQAAAKSLAQLTVVLDKSNRDIDEIRHRISELEDSRSDLEQQMAASEKALASIRRRRRVARDFEKAEEELETAREKFKEVAPQAWIAVLTPTVEAALDKLGTRRRVIERAQHVYDREQLMFRLRVELSETGKCPCCGQLADTPDVKSSQSANDHSVTLDDIRTRMESLEQTLDLAAVTRLDERNRTLQTAAMKVHDLASDLAEAEEQIKGLADPNLNNLPTRLSNTKIQIVNLHKNLREAEEKRTEDTQYANRLAAVIAERGGEAGAAATKKQNLLTGLQRLYSLSIDKYREELKERVEQEATEVFLSIQSDPDFAHLSINGDYGLSIVHKDGELEPQRSAGYEHIVALSLVAALQRCAPVQAPIFMDMPFARLDPKHTLSTLRALPSVADQVVVIVHEGEINHDEAQETLKSDLVCERQLARRSARHTEILELGVR